MPFDEDRWIEEDLTFEMKVMLCLPGPSKAINSGPLQCWVTALTCSDMWNPQLFWSLLTLRPERLVMFSLSCSSSSFGPSPSSSVYRDGASVSSFLGKYPILKSNASDGILAVDYCRPTDTICMGWSPSEGPFFFLYSCLFFLICMLASFFTTSRWASFNRSTWLPLSSTQTPEPLTKPFVLSVICSVCLQPLILF